MQFLDHGFGAAGVAVNSAPAEGVRTTPLSQIKSTFPVLRNPANRHRAVGLTYEQWHYPFTNTFSEEESRALYERLAVPASGGILWGIVLANLQPGRQNAWVDYQNDDRAPLLSQRGQPHAAEGPAVEREALQVEHRHRGQGVRGPGAPAFRTGRLGGGRRLRAVLGRRIEIDGWRLLTDPTFDPAGGSRISAGASAGSRRCEVEIAA